MKTPSYLIKCSALLLTFCLGGFVSTGQVNKIVGSYWMEGKGFTFSAVDIASASHADLDHLQGVGGLFLGETTYDETNHRYIQSTDRGILLIDAENGEILESIDNPLRMKGIEYSTNMDLLVGTYWTGTHELFVTLDFPNKTFTPLDTLHGVQWLAAGESTYDVANDRYFNKTIELGITVIDAQTGAILETIPNPINMKGIEYNPTTGQLMGSYWNETNEIFTTLDLTSKTYTDLNLLPGVHYLMAGESSYDPVNDWYANRTDLGFTLITGENGVIFQSIPDPKNVTGIELMRSHCELALSRQPESRKVVVNSKVQFIVATSDESATYQWQINRGDGFVNLANSGQFTGSTDDTLSISHVTLENTNQFFRCIIRSGSCKTISIPAYLEVTNALTISGEDEGENETEDLEDGGEVLGAAGQIDLLIFPNPTSDYITIRVSSSYIGASVQLFDATGQSVITDDIQHNLTTLRLAHLARGIYFLRIGGSQDTFKLVKN